MDDPRTAQGVGRMFPGTLGGHARPAQPVTPTPPRPARWVPPVSIVADLDPYLFTSTLVPYAPVTRNRELVVWDYASPITDFAGGAAPSDPISGSYSSITLPAGTYAAFGVSFTFAELDLHNVLITAGDPGGTDTVTRTLELQVRDATVAESSPAPPLWNDIQSVTGPRYATVVAVTAPAMTFTTSVKVRAYCTYTDIREDAAITPAVWIGGVFVTPSTGVRIAGH